MSDIIIKYKGEKIKFFEHTDEWAWSHASNVSLKKVKEAIDRSQKVVFERTTAYRHKYNDWERVQVTSQAETGEFWIKDGKGKREKINRRYLFLDCSENTERLKELAALEAQAEELQGQITSLENKMLPFEVKAKSEPD